MNSAQIILVIVVAYMAIGFVVAVTFVCFGITSVDPVAKGSSMRFRVLIIPGTAALWPIMLRKWCAAKRGEVVHDTK